MTTYQTFAAGWASAISILEGAYGKSVIDMCKDGLDTTMAKLLQKLATVYYGSTGHTRYQERSRRTAAEKRHTLHTLNEIEKQINKLNNKKHSWKMREELTKQPPILRTIRARGNELLAEYNGPEKVTNETSISARALPNSTNMRLTATAPGHLVRAAMDSLASVPEDQRAEEAIKRIFGGGEATEPKLAARVIVRADDVASIGEELPDGDVILSLTNGTRVLSSDLARENLAEHCRIVLVSPMLGVLNVFEGRFATDKQREARAAVEPVCTCDGCGTGADYCQINHNVPYSRGGPTSNNNLSTVCDYDNGRMSDTDIYGHIEQRGGENYHVSPFGQARLNDHPVARGGAMRLVKHGPPRAAPQAASNATTESAASDPASTT
ncbi:HNH endonuclease signature motif containing protein [Corynebacterium cystitidis]|uniref:HNH endonuclease signature motif containing protein n=1 Tax=Corynebacterium cystitidis TaxID=35757 RepID=UPI00211F14D1|nr:HNH endonuclease signature motif containing protein [Corynebacterium cystitidis]